MAPGLKPPYVWFGGKRSVADLVWAALGNPRHYLEPFFGGGAVLLARPDAPELETINDIDGYVVNFWRAVQADPLAVAQHAASPVYESDLHAWKARLSCGRADFTSRQEGNPDFYDAQVAGRWMWGLNISIGPSFLPRAGPWKVVDGRLIKSDSGAGTGVSRSLPSLSLRLDYGIGCSLSNSIPENIKNRMLALSKRVSKVRVTCGDWSRILSDCIVAAAGYPVGVFLDPPYSLAMRDNVYAEDHDVAADVSKWCAANGGNHDLRIVLAGYEGEHNHLQALGWRVHAWKAKGGYANQGRGRANDNAARERLWFSPGCLNQSHDLFTHGSSL